MEIIATFDCNVGTECRELSISLDGQKVVLNKEQFETLSNVLGGKLGEIMKFRSREDYSPYEVIRFSCEKPFHASSVDSD